MFLPGDSVFYPAIKKHGTVLRVVNLGDATDIKQQGYRYEVYFRSTGWTYSIPQSALTAKR